MTASFVQLFELSKTKKRWAVVWRYQKPNPEPLVSFFNFSRLKTESVGQLFESFNTHDRNHWAVVWNYPDQKSWAIVWTFRDPWLKTYGNCQKLPKPKTEAIGQLLEVIKTQDRNSWSVVCASQDYKCWAVVWTSHDANPKSLGCSFYFSRLKTKQVENLVELRMTHDRIGWSVVWNSKNIIQNH